MDDKVRLIVVINPNNPTGGVPGRDQLIKIINIASSWPNCAIISDEIYDEINFSGNHYSLASLSKNIPVITLNGVSKNYYAPGWRIGYMALHDPSNNLSLVRDGVERLLRSRLCASTPAQLGYFAGLEGSREWMKDYNNTLIKQRDLCIKRIDSIDGLEVTKPNGAFYMFVRITHDKWAANDKDFVLKLLHEEHVLMVHGSGFSSEYGRGYFRLVFLPSLDIINEAFDRVEKFLLRYK
jgi:aspartate/methionine/tyrosine aminotransferase